jgi:hypothetical protein
MEHRGLVSPSESGRQSHRWYSTVSRDHHSPVYARVRQPIGPSEQTGAELIGQVLREGEPTFESVSALKIELARGETQVFSTATDETGEFRITGVEQGVYDLRIQLSEGNITVPDLPLVES